MARVAIHDTIAFSERPHFNSEHYPGWGPHDGWTVQPEWADATPKKAATQIPFKRPPTIPSPPLKAPPPPLAGHVAAPQPKGPPMSKGPGKVAPPLPPPPPAPGAAGSPIPIPVPSSMPTTGSLAKVPGPKAGTGFLTDPVGPWKAGPSKGHGIRADMIRINALNLEPAYDGLQQQADAAFAKMHPNIDKPDTASQPPPLATTSKTPSVPQQQATSATPACSALLQQVRAAQAANPHAIPGLSVQLENLLMANVNEAKKFTQECSATALLCKAQSQSRAEMPDHWAVPMMTSTSFTPIGMTPDAAGTMHKILAESDKEYKLNNQVLKFTGMDEGFETRHPEYLPDKTWGNQVRVHMNMLRTRFYSGYMPKTYDNMTYPGETLGNITRYYTTSTSGVISATNTLPANYRFLDFTLQHQKMIGKQEMNPFYVHKQMYMKAIFSAFHDNRQKGWPDFQLTENSSEVLNNIYNYMVRMWTEAEGDFKKTLELCSTIGEEEPEFNKKLWTVPSRFANVPVHLFDSMSKRGKIEVGQLMKLFLNSRGYHYKQQLVAMANTMLWYCLTEHYGGTVVNKGVLPHVPFVQALTRACWDSSDVMTRRAILSTLARDHSLRGIINRHEKLVEFTNGADTYISGPAETDGIIDFARTMGSIHDAVNVDPSANQHRTQPDIDDGESAILTNSMLEFGRMSIDEQAKVMTMLRTFKCVVCEMDTKLLRERPTSVLSSDAHTAAFLDRIVADIPDVGDDRRYNVAIDLALEFSTTSTTSESRLHAYAVHTMLIERRNVLADANFENDMQEAMRQSRMQPEQRDNEPSGTLSASSASGMTPPATAASPPSPPRGEVAQAMGSVFEELERDMAKLTIGMTRDDWTAVNRDENFTYVTTQMDETAFHEMGNRMVAQREAIEEHHDKVKKLRNKKIETTSTPTVLDCSQPLIQTVPDTAAPEPEEGVRAEMPGPSEGSEATHKGADEDMCEAILGKAQLILCQHCGGMHASSPGLRHKCIRQDSCGRAIEASGFIDIDDTRLSVANLSRIPSELRSAAMRLVERCDAVTQMQEAFNVQLRARQADEHSLRVLRSCLPEGAPQTSASGQAAYDKQMEDISTAEKLNEMITVNLDNMQLAVDEAIRCMIRTRNMFWCQMMDSRQNRPLCVRAIFQTNANILVKIHAAQIQENALVNEAVHRLHERDGEATLPTKVANWFGGHKKLRTLAGELRSFTKTMDAKWVPPEYHSSMKIAKDLLKKIEMSILARGETLYDFEHEYIEYMQKKDSTKVDLESMDGPYSDIREEDINTLTNILQELRSCMEETSPTIRSLLRDLAEVINREAAPEGDRPHMNAHFQQYILESQERLARRERKRQS